MNNILPFRKKSDPLPLTKVDVSRRPITEPFVLCLLSAGFRLKSEGNRVWLVKNV